MKFSFKNIFSKKTKDFSTNSSASTYDESWNTEEYRRKSAYWTNETIIDKAEIEILNLIYQKSLLEIDIESFFKAKNKEVSMDCFHHYDIYENLNFPGPFYTGESDTCGTGVTEAPENVVFSNDGQEFIMIQPRTTNELIQVLNAGAVECFSAYSCFGNEIWNPELVRNWWADKDKLIDYLKSTESDKSNFNQNRRYIKYLKTYAEEDLRKYIFFLETGSYPSESVSDLPKL